MTAVAQKNSRTVAWLAVVLAFMIALVALSPVLYRTFCSLTGFDGTPLRAEKAPGAVAGQVRVRFDANVHPGLPWRFEPEQNYVTVKPGAQNKIYYRATNLSARTIRAQAAYNVSPDQVGKYFKKIQCFCFNEQTLKPGETVDMPVIFFVDPQFAKDADTKEIDEITLSYTFYPVETVNAPR